MKSEPRALYNRTKVVGYIYHCTVSTVVWGNFIWICSEWWWKCRKWVDILHPHILSFWHNPKEGGPYIHKVMEAVRLWCLDTHAHCSTLSSCFNGWEFMFNVILLFQWLRNHSACICTLLSCWYKNTYFPCNWFSLSQKAYKYGVSDQLLDGDHLRFPFLYFSLSIIMMSISMELLRGCRYLFFSSCL